MAALRVFERLSYGTLPGFRQTCDGCGLATTTTDWMSLICADDWIAIHLHEDCLVLWEEERNSQIPGSI